ncbi:MAG TPA: carbon-nitrogen hydrolase family protein [Bryobacteraceae bacterium]|nr:carbon-nitrogen hydrolase family protein [Bryobacteraceae bacterium]
MSWFVAAAQAGGRGEPTGVNLKVAAVQFRASTDVEDNARRMADDLNRLADQGVQVAAFPEYSLVPYDGKVVTSVPATQVAALEEQLRKVCRDRKIAAIFGSVYKVNGHIYNSAVVFDSHGELIERYGKIHLAGENWCTPGNHISYFELEGVPSTVMICHDERYPELARLPAIAGARVLYYISHESGLDQETKLVPYRAQLQARAVENQIFIVNANAPSIVDNVKVCHGQSRIIRDDGNILQEASIFGQDILVETLPIQLGLNRQMVTRPLKDLMNEWWRAGVDDMMKNRHRTLE